MTELGMLRQVSHRIPNRVNTIQKPREPFKAQKLVSKLAGDTLKLLCGSSGNCGSTVTKHQIMQWCSHHLVQKCQFSDSRVPVGGAGSFSLSSGFPFSIQNEMTHRNANSFQSLPRWWKIGKIGEMFSKESRERRIVWFCWKVWKVEIGGEVLSRHTALSIFDLKLTKFWAAYGRRFDKSKSFRWRQFGEVETCGIQWEGRLIDANSYQIFENKGWKWALMTLFDSLLITRLFVFVFLMVIWRESRMIRTV